MNYIFVKGAILNTQDLVLVCTFSIEPYCVFRDVVAGRGGASIYIQVNLHPGLSTPGWCSPPQLLVSSSSTSCVWHSCGPPAVPFLQCSSRRSPAELPGSSLSSPPAIPSCSAATALHRSTRTFEGLISSDSRHTAFHFPLDVAGQD